jgi:hypothetical protein
MSDANLETPASNLTPFLLLGDAQCREIVAYGEDNGPLCCGQMTSRGPYCKSHWAKNYLPRVEDAKTSRGNKGKSLPPFV